MKEHWNNIKCLIKTTIGRKRVEDENRARAANRKQ